MYHLATAIPQIQRFRLPLSRDQVVLLMMAVNEIFLGLDTYLSHVLNGNIRPNEWTPIIFGPIAGVLLLVAGVIAIRQRFLASTIASVTLLASIAVGLLGAYLHFVRGIWPSAPLGQRVSLDLLIWAPPVLGPLYFSLVGLLGISAAWVEDPVDSGILLISKRRQLHLPYSKTQAYFFAVAMGILAAIVSSTFDHAREGFENPWFWWPTLAGVFALAITIMLGFIDKPTRADLLTYIGGMILLIIVGVIGLVLHVQSNLIAEGTIVTERFLRGAPFLAPLLYANMGALGLIVLFDPDPSRK